MSDSIRKKLIEVALPLPEINDASAYDKMPGIGPHPKGIHHWWARLPLPCARSILFASVVDDPSEHPETFSTEAAQDAERERLFDIVRRMMQKRLHTHPEVYAEARAEMEKYCDGKLPAVLDPFSGGGSIPLEANRLGFEAHAADLNPVAVILNKCNLELAPRWSGQAPINPEDRRKIGGGQSWQGTTGLAADVRYYAEQVGESVKKKIGQFYPTVKLPESQGGGDGKVIAWIWARTIASSDAAIQGARVPLISTFWLSSVAGKYAWLEPVVDKAERSYRFEVKTGTPSDAAAIKSGTKLGKKANFRCILSDQPLPYKYVRGEAAAQRVGRVLLAIVVETKRSRTYLPATPEHVAAAEAATPAWMPEELVTTPCHDVDRLPMYGMPRWGDAFTSRQLLGLTTISDTLRDFRAKIQADAEAAGLDVVSAQAYSRAVSTFLALALDRCTDFNNSVCRWNSGNQKVMNLFGKQAIPMNWDFAEANLLGDTVGSWSTCSDYVATCVETIQVGKTPTTGRAQQADAATGAEGVTNLLVSTDPPYYDNIGYADLSDFFYVWLRRTLAPVYPSLFRTLLTPKAEELIATPHRHDESRDKAMAFFETGLGHAFERMRESEHADYPLTVFYAFKQAESEEDDDEQGGENESSTASTGWETMLEGLIRAGFAITGTWPVRTERSARSVSIGTNALASSIVLVCHPRGDAAPMASRREFVAALKRELPVALRDLQSGNIAPVDLAQAAIGPGMAVYSRYSKVLETSGDRMGVRTALALINQVLDEVLAEQEGEYDADTRWCIKWFEQFAHADGPYGDAETLCKAMAVAVNGLVETGVVAAKGGKVRLFKRAELMGGKPETWDPATDDDILHWEVCQYLCWALETGGEQAAADLLRRINAVYAGATEVARDLAYRLYTLCERKKWAQEAISYNALVVAWPEIQKLAAKGPAAPEGSLYAR